MERKYVYSGILCTVGVVIVVFSAVHFRPSTTDKKVGVAATPKIVAPACVPDFGELSDSEDKSSEHVEKTSQGVFEKPPGYIAVSWRGAKDIAYLDVEKMLGAEEGPIAPAGSSSSCTGRSSSCTGSIFERAQPYSAMYSRPVVSYEAGVAPRQFAANSWQHVFAPGPSPSANIAMPNVRTEAPREHIPAKVTVCTSSRNARFLQKMKSLKARSEYVKILAQANHDAKECIEKARQESEARIKKGKEEALSMVNNAYITYSRIKQKALDEAMEDAAERREKMLSEESQRLMEEEEARKEAELRKIEENRKIEEKYQEAAEHLEAAKVQANLLMEDALRYDSLMLEGAQTKANGILQDAHKKADELEKKVIREIQQEAEKVSQQHEVQARMFEEAMHKRLQALKKETEDLYVERHRLKEEAADLGKQRAFSEDYRARLDAQSEEIRKKQKELEKQAEEVQQNREAQNVRESKLQIEILKTEKYREELENDQMKLMNLREGLEADALALKAAKNKLNDLKAQVAREKSENEQLSSTNSAALASERLKIQNWEKDLNRRQGALGARVVQMNEMEGRLAIGTEKLRAAQEVLQESIRIFEEEKAKGSELERAQADARRAELDGLKRKLEDDILEHEELKKKHSLENAAALADLEEKIKTHTEELEAERSILALEKQKNEQHRQSLLAEAEKIKQDFADIKERAAKAQEDALSNSEDKSALKRMEEHLLNAQKKLDEDLESLEGQRSALSREKEEFESHVQENNRKLEEEKKSLCKRHKELTEQEKEIQAQKEENAAALEAANLQILESNRLQMLVEQKETDKLRELNAELANLKMCNSAIGKQLGEKSEMHTQSEETARRNIEALNAEVNSLKLQGEENAQKFNALVQSAQSAKSAAELASESLRALGEEKARLEESMQELEESMQELEESMQELEESKQTADAEAQKKISCLESGNRILADQIEQKQDEAEKLKAELEKLGGEKEEQVQKNIASLERIQSLAASEELLNAELCALKTEYAKLEEKQLDLQKKHNESKKAQEMLAAQLQKTKEDYEDRIQKLVDTNLQDSMKTLDENNQVASQKMQQMKDEESRKIAALEEKYLALQKEKDKEIDAAVNSAAEKDAQNNQHMKHIEDLNEEVAQLNQISENKEQTIVLCMDQISQMQSVVEANKKELDDLKNLHEEKEKEANKKHAQHDKEMADLLSKNQAERKSLVEMHARAEKKLNEEHAEKVKEIEASLAASQAELEDLKKLHEKKQQELSDNHAQQVECLQAQLKDSQTELQDMLELKNQSHQEGEEMSQKLLQKIKELQEKVRDSQAELEDLKKLHEKKEQELSDNHAQQVKILEAELGASQAELETAVKLHEKKEQELSDEHAQQVKVLEAELGASQAELETAVKLHETKEQELSDMHAQQVKVLEAQLKDSQTELEDLKKLHETKEQELSDNHAQQAEKMKTRMEKNQTYLVSVHEKEKKELQDTIEALNERVLGMESIKKASESDMMALQENLDSSLKNVSNLEDALFASNCEVANLKDQMLNYTDKSQTLMCMLDVKNKKKRLDKVRSEEANILNYAKVSFLQENPEACKNMSAEMKYERMLNAHELVNSTIKTLIMGRRDATVGIQKEHLHKVIQSELFAVKSEFEKNGLHWGNLPPTSKEAGTTRAVLELPKGNLEDTLRCLLRYNQAYQEVIRESALGYSHDLEMSSLKRSFASMLEMPSVKNLSNNVPGFLNTLVLYTLFLKDMLECTGNAIFTEIDVFARISEKLMLNYNKNSKNIPEDKKVNMAEYKSAQRASIRGVMDEAFVLWADSTNSNVIKMSQISGELYQKLEPLYSNESKKNFQNNIAFNSFVMAYKQGYRLKTETAFSCEAYRSVLFGPLINSFTMDVKTLCFKTPTISTENQKINGKDPQKGSTSDLRSDSTKGSTSDLRKSSTNGSTSDLRKSSTKGSTSDLRKSSTKGSTSDLRKSSTKGSTSDLRKSSTKGSTSDLRKSSTNGSTSDLRSDPTNSSTCDLRSDPTNDQILDFFVQHTYLEKMNHEGTHPADWLAYNVFDPVCLGMPEKPSQNDPTKPKQAYVVDQNKIIVMASAILIKIEKLLHMVCPKPEEKMQGALDIVKAVRIATSILSCVAINQYSVLCEHRSSENKLTKHVYSLLFKGNPNIFLKSIAPSPMKYEDYILAMENVMNQQEKLPFGIATKYMTRALTWEATIRKSKKTSMLQYNWSNNQAELLVRTHYAEYQNGKLRSLCNQRAASSVLHQDNEESDFLKGQTE
ncbi:uncharacterized protein NEMAJ01_1602 [Nematocida major]|uniref:uncharacterized protein n=1 Tax=Nematocida major TaxID=1912982 RepID=UPI002007936D|nr:uncharacterized protein NEMAJ01_1602 [Nematocida major]KAH9386706.1 hypothetical protein NEMAJ01_1602 [Nematocida major]